MVGIMPHAVSYTHLDVYKRQLISSPLNIVSSFGTYVDSPYFVYDDEKIAA